MTLLDHDPEDLRDLLKYATDEEAVQIGQALRAEIEERRYDWSRNARPEQLAPEGDWHVWLIMAGRGYGKTRTGAEWIRREATANPGGRYAVVAPTFADCRDTCVEGESGLLAVIPPDRVRTWNRSLGELSLVNGSRIKLFSADEPDRLRGPQFHGAWCDELASWRYPDTWDQLQFGLRLGSQPRTVVTTTPRPTRLVRSLVERAHTGPRFNAGELSAPRDPRDRSNSDVDDARTDSSVVITRGNTFDNAANLAPSALEELRNRYEGTRLGRQELFGELLTDVPGALWTLAMIDDSRVREHPDLTKSVVAVDPSGGDSETNDEQGIIVAGSDGREGYVIADRSCRLSPDGWGRRAVAAYDEFACDAIVAEDNYGGQMVEHVVTTAARDMGIRVNFRKVHSSRGKKLRAEPIAAMYEQNRIHHVGIFADLEEQLVNWTPDSGQSPDRLDAMVFALSYLLLEGPQPGTARMHGARIRNTQFSGIG